MVRIPLPGQRTTLNVLLTAFTTILILRLAWLSDDSLITLRTALNAAHGWGYGFNALERVQGYTHPLWFLSWLGIGSVTDQWVYSILLFSVMLSGAAVYLILQQTTSLARAFFVCVALIFSNSFMEYSTSGLENPLSHLLIVGLILTTVKNQLSQPQLFLFGVLTASALLTRLDFVVLIGLPVAFALWMATQHNRRGLVLFSLGFLLPLVTWFVWSWRTYASLLPNTFQAKRNVNIPASELLDQGLNYVVFSLRHDPMTAVILVLGITTAFLAKRKIFSIWSLGVIAYLAYVVQNGGDFMVGRFLSVPFITSLAILIMSTAHLPWVFTRTRPMIRSSIAIAVIAVTASISWPVSLSKDLEAERWSLADPTAEGIADERPFYVQSGLGLWPFLLNREKYTGSVNLGVINQEANFWPLEQMPGAIPKTSSVLCGGLGGAGIISGPTQHIIDSCGLTDRFIAETPFTSSNGKWRIGHFQRLLPDGYPEAIEYADPNRVIDPQERLRLVALWEKIRD